MGNKMLGYDFLKEGYSDGKAQNSYILCEVVSKTNTKMVGKLIVGSDKTDVASTKPYLIVRDVPEGVKDKIKIKAGDVVEQVNMQLITFVGKDEARYALIEWDKIGLIYSKLDDSPEKYIVDREFKLDLSGASLGDD